MYFFIKHYDILKKCSTIWKKVNADIEKEFDSDPVFNNEVLKTKAKSHGDEITDFYD